MGVPSIGLGWTPVGLTVIVSPGVNFFATIKLEDDAGAAVNWPVGTAARLVITKGAFSATWTPTISTNVMQWNIGAATVDAAPDGSHAQLFLTYGTDPEQLWQAGGLVRRS